MKAFRVLAFFLAVSAAWAQVPGMFPWWDRPIARDLGLSQDQEKKIRTIVKESRTRLIQLRGAVEAAEEALKDEMNEPEVDARRATDAIERIVAARADLMRAVSQMSLQLRMVLTSTQWQELQRRVPRPDLRVPAPVPAPGRPVPPEAGPANRSPDPSDFEYRTPYQP